MKWLEIVEIRSIRSKRETLKAEMQELMKDEGKMMDEGQAIKIYNHVTVDSDFNIHLFHDSENVETSGSSLGLYLASFLIKHGLVNHSIWIQET